MPKAQSAAGYKIFETARRLKGRITLLLGATTSAT